MFDEKDIIEAAHLVATSPNINPMVSSAFASFTRHLERIADKKQKEREKRHLSKDFRTEGRQ